MRGRDGGPPPPDRERCSWIEWSGTRCRKPAALLLSDGPLERQVCRSHAAAGLTRGWSVVWTEEEWEGALTCQEGRAEHLHDLRRRGEG